HATPSSLPDALPTSPAESTYGDKLPRVTCVVMWNGQKEQIAQPRHSRADEPTTVYVCVPCRKFFEKLTFLAEVPPATGAVRPNRSEEHTSELQSPDH